MLRAGFFNVMGQSLNSTLATNSLSCDPCPKDCCPENTTCVQTYAEGVGNDYSCSSSNESHTASAYFSWELRVLALLVYCYCAKGRLFLSVNR